MSARLMPRRMPSFQQLDVDKAKTQTFAGLDKKGQGGIPRCVEKCSMADEK